jgi:hypothetical protein
MVESLAVGISGVNYYEGDKMTHQRQGKYKQRDYEMVKIYQPLVYCYSEHIETGWRHTETVSADRGLEVQVRARK